MTLIFQGSDNPTIGVEIELQILDPSTLDLTPKSEIVLETCSRNGVDRIKSEVHQSMLEIDSEIATDVKECRRFLASKLHQLFEISNSLNLELTVTGTHPFQRWTDRLISNDDRYKNLHQKYQWLIRRMNIYGMHVHVAIPSGDLVLKTLNVLTPFLPHLLALSANSPFWQGVDTGMNSSRLSILEAFPYAGIPPYFSEWKEFEHYYKTLHSVGAIGSMKDLYWYIRPNLTFGTLEFRICDGMSTLSETMAVTALIHCLVVWANEHLIENAPPELGTLEYQWIIRENQWSAARDGLDAIIIENIHGKKRKLSESILDLIQTLSPIALRLNCVEELSYLKKIIEHGNGAQRQRHIYQQTGSLQDVVATKIREFKADIDDLAHQF